MSSKNILILPDLFPKNKGDLGGIFVLDYLSCIKDLYSLRVYYIRLYSQVKLLANEKWDGIDIFRKALFTKPVPSFLKPLFYLFWFFRGYKDCIKFDDTKLIHAHGIILNGTLAFLISKKLNIPFIISVHQGPFSKISDNVFKRYWAKKILEKADSVLVVSKHLGNEIIGSKIYPKKLIVTYNPVNTEIFKIYEDIKKQKSLIFVGRLDNFKGALRTVLAFSSIVEKIPDWELLIIGDGEDGPAIRSYIATNNVLKCKIKLLGQREKEEIAIELNKSAFFVFPSLHESFGLVIAEAMSCGLPVIVGDKTAPVEYVDDECGLRIDAEDINAISNAILTMTETYSMYDAHKIRRKVVDLFGLVNFGSRLDLIYSELLK